MTNAHTKFHEDWMNFNVSDKSFKKIFDKKMTKIGKNGQISALSGHFLCNPSSDLHEILCAGVSNDYLTTSFSDQIDMMMLPLLIFSKN